VLSRVILDHCSNRFGNGLDDCLEVVLKGGATDEEAVYIWLLDQLTTVSSINRATIQDSSLASNFLGNVLGKPCSNFMVSFLSLLWSCDLTGTDSPNWLISNDDLTPVSLIELIGDGFKLSSVDLSGLATFSLFELLANTSHNTDSFLKGSLGLQSNILIRLLMESSSLGVTGECPMNANILKLISSNISSISTLWIL